MVPKVTADYDWREVWPRRGDVGGLPPGQRAARAMPRFGMRPGLAPPPAPLHPTVSVTGDVAERITIDADALGALERVTLEADFHCVTTWSVRGLAWSGWRMRDVWDRIIEPLALPAAGATHLRAIASDRYSAALPLQDALADDVLLADRLGGFPLQPIHGAPWRLVAPAHYGYKSVKHLAAITVHRSRPRASGGAMQHPRGRVAVEERHGWIPGTLLRWPYRVLIVPTALRARRVVRRG